MTRAEAFEVLGLEPDASTQQIQARWRELARELHPDSGGTDGSAFERLQQARGVALRPQAADLVPFEQVMELARIFRGDLAEREEQRMRRAEGERAVERLVRVHTSRLRRLQRRAAFFTGVAGAFALLAQGLRALPNLPTTVSTALSLGLAVYAVGLGLLVWRFRERAQAVEDAIGDVSETFDDRSAVVDVIHEIAEASGLRLPFMRHQLTSGVSDWSGSRNAPSSSLAASSAELLFGSDEEADVRGLAFMIGPSDFARLVIAKGLESGVLEEREKVSEDRLVVLYDLRLPSRETT